MSTYSPTYPKVTLVRPEAEYQADLINEIVQHSLIGFDRPMEPSDLQGPDSRFPWTERSAVSLTNDKGQPKIVHCNRLASHCPEHNIYWLDQDFPGCPRCDELDAP